MNLKYQNISIRNATADDAHLLASWWNDGAVMAHAGFPNGLGTTAEKVAQGLVNDSDDTRRRLILELGGEPIGELCTENHGSGICEIDIKICESQHQERGIGRITLSMLISHLFASGYSKIILDTNLNNARAQHVYEKLGFKKVRVNLNSWTNQLGQPESSVDYELTPQTFHNFAI